MNDVLLLAAAIIVAVIATVLAFVPSVRASIRVHLLKLFSRYKYDYRREWLRFIDTLSSAESEQVHNVAVRAVAQIVKSPGGVVWAKPPDEAFYVPVGAWGAEMPAVASVSENAKLIRFLERRQWIIDLKEFDRHPQRYDDLELSELFKGDSNWWLIVPLLLGDDVFGFIALLKPLVTFKLNFEDHDLLKTVGKQVATHIKQAEIDRRLAEISQFTTYNRLSAYLMHDLSNLIAQHSLVVQNAERFGNNPDFVDDAFKTIAHSVSRMERLVSDLSKRPERPISRVVDVGHVVGIAVDRSAQRRPSPCLDVADESLYTTADPEQLATVIEHLIRNAQEATSGAGEVRIGLSAHDGMARIGITDTGSGMTPEFVRERLFRPFDSTKGSESMGIGAYQAREYIRSIGGQVQVTSEVGVGTTFLLTVPLSDNEKRAADLSTPGNT
jgi:putative PEP-CTERM system histidine kinase